MTTATCLGTTLAGDCIAGAGGAVSDRQHFGFLGLDQAVDLRDDAVRQALHIVLATPLIVLRHRLVLEQAFELLVGLTAKVAYRHLGVFTGTADHLGQVAPTLLVSAGMGTRNRSP